MRLLLLALTALVLAGCGSASGPRKPSPAERRAIAADVRAVWEYESSGRPTWADPAQYRRALLPPDLHPKVVSVRVSRTKPRFASAAVELWGTRERWPPGTAVVVFKWVGKTSESLTRPWDLVAGPASRFPPACTSGSPKGLRDLLCPSPWSVLRYRGPRIPPSRAYALPLPSEDLHRVDWRRVPVPAKACGTVHPVPLRGGTAFAHSVVYPWWSVIDIGAAWEKGVVSYGDLDGDGRDEAAVAVTCGNGGGTAGGQLAFATVIFTARRKSLRVLGIVTPQQPLGPAATHVPIVSRVRIRGRTVVAPEAWYGPDDGTCCPSGRARTVWRYTRAGLRPSQTVVERPSKP
jgi:hypothetical protein